MFRHESKEGKTNNESARKGIRLTLNVGVKLFLLFLISILLSVGITGVVSLSVSNNIIEQKSADSAYETIQQASAKVDTILEVYEQIVMQILSRSTCIMICTLQRMTELL